MKNITSKETGWMGCLKPNCFMYVSCRSWGVGCKVSEGYSVSKESELLSASRHLALLPCCLHPHTRWATHTSFSPWQFPVDPASHYLLNSPWAMSSLLTYFLFDQQLISLDMLITHQV